MSNFVLNTEDANWYSDLFKSVNGFRPGSYAKFDSQKEFDEEIQNLIDQSNLQMDEEKIQDTKALEKYEFRILKLQHDFNLTHVNAIRWDMQAEDIQEYDMSYYLYCQGLNSIDSDKIISEFKESVK